MVLFIFLEAFGNPYFDEKGQAKEGLIHLLQVTGAPLPDKRDLASIAVILEKSPWSSAPGTDRWDMVLASSIQEKSPSVASEIIRICEQELGLESVVYPEKNKKYLGVLFLGATLKRVVDRLEFYKKMVKEGKIDSKLPLWVLTGERTLSVKAGETEEYFNRLVPKGEKKLPYPKNERDMIKFVFHYGLRTKNSVKYVFSKKDPNHVRATTASTMVSFLREAPSLKGTFLAISNQPYVFYQETVLLLEARKNNFNDVSIVAIGDYPFSPTEDKNNKAAIFLDNVRRTVLNLKSLSDI